jgi:glycerol-3-phosphate dehydrogenase (NAD(P)+)
MSPPVGIIGAGGFGRGLAAAASRGDHDVILYSRVGKKVDAPKVRTTKDYADLAEAELIFLAVPSRFVREVAAEVGAHLDGSHLMVHVSRGLVGDELETLTRVVRDATPVRRVGVLAGPLSAEALAEGRPSGGVVGTGFPEVTDAVRDAIGGPELRLYSTTDVMGVEVASAMVGLLTVCAGFAQGMGLGPSTLAIMSTRGLAEAARVGAALGADERTFHGLAGVGDLMSAVSGDDRPELRLGRALGRGSSLDEAAEEAGANIEGAAIAHQVASFVQSRGFEAPISAAVADVLSGECTPKQAVGRLMTRQVGVE